MLELTKCPHWQSPVTGRPAQENTMVLKWVGFTIRGCKPVYLKKAMHE